MQEIGLQFDLPTTKKDYQRQLRLSQKLDKALSNEHKVLRNAKLDDRAKIHAIDGDFDKQSHVKQIETGKTVPNVPKNQVPLQPQLQERSVHLSPSPSRLATPDQ
jgi:hypothetical protein